MPSETAFIILIIVAIILLIVISLSTTIAASDAFNSTYYNTSPDLRTAHEYLTSAACIGWIVLTILLIVFAVAVYTGALKVPVINEGLLANPNPAQSDVVKAYDEQKKLENVKTTSLIFLVTLAILGLIILIAGILSAIAATKIGDLPQKDSKAGTAYTAAILSAVLGVGVLVIIIFAIIAYYGIRKYQNTKEQQLKTFTSGA